MNYDVKNLIRMDHLRHHHDVCIYIRILLALHISTEPDSSSLTFLHDYRDLNKYCIMYTLEVG